MAADLAIPDGGTISGHGQARSPLLVAHIEEHCPSAGQVVGIDGEIAAARRPCEVGGQISGRLPHARRTSGHKTPAVAAIAPGPLHLSICGPGRMRIFSASTRLTMVKSAMTSFDDMSEDLSQLNEV